MTLRREWKRPIPISIRTIEDAERYLDDLAHDLSYALRGTGDELTREHYSRLRTVSETYRRSADDFVSQVNLLETPPELRAWKGRLQRSQEVPERVLDYLRLTWQFGSREGSVEHLHRLLERTLHARRDPMHTPHEPIRDGALRSHLAGHFLDRVAHYGDELGVLEGAGFVEQLRERFSRSADRARRRLRRTAGVLGVAALALTGWGAVELGGEVQDARRARFGESLELDRVARLHNAYVSDAQDLLDAIDTFADEAYVSQQAQLLLTRCYADFAVRSDWELDLWQDHACNDHLAELGDDPDRAALLNNYQGFVREVHERVDSLFLRERQLRTVFRHTLNAIRRYEEPWWRPSVPAVTAEVLGMENQFVSNATQIDDALSAELRRGNITQVVLFAEQARSEYDTSRPMYGRYFGLPNDVKSMGDLFIGHLRVEDAQLRIAGDPVPTLQLFGEDDLYQALTRYLDTKITGVGWRR